LNNLLVGTVRATPCAGGIQCVGIFDDLTDSLVPPTFVDDVQQTGNCSATSGAVQFENSQLDLPANGTMVVFDVALQEVAP
jgi:hypothetical protein